MGKKSKLTRAPAAAVESVQATLESEAVKVIQEQLKNQNKSALANGFAHSAAVFGKTSTYVLEKAEAGKTADDTKEPQTKVNKKTKENITDEKNDGAKKKKKEKKKKRKKSETAEEGNEELIHEDEKARRTVFVGNVSLDATQKDVKKHFAKCGKVASVRLRYLPIAGCAVDEAGNQKLMMKVCANQKILTTAKDHCNAYVMFAEERSVDAALKLNGTTLAHKRIRVDHAEPVIDARRSIFIGNVPFKCTDEQLVHFFSKRLKTDEEPEPIENVRLIRDRESGLGKGFGYLLLKTPALVAKTLALRTLKMENRELRVQVSGKRFKNLRGEETVKEKFEGSRASIGARARIHLKRKVGTKAIMSKKLEREATAAGLGKKLKPKHAARKAAKAMSAASGNLSKKRKAEPSGNNKRQKRPCKKPTQAVRNKATKT